MLLRHAPQLAKELFLHVGALPPETASWSLHLWPSEGIIIRPEQKRREMRADLLLLVAVPGVDVATPWARQRALQAGRAYGVIFEIQRVEDAEKPHTWADFWGAYRRELGTDMRLVILTLDAITAKWARDSTERLQNLMKVFVVTPDDCPEWPSVGAEYESERTVLDAVLHARDASHLELVEAALVAIDGWDDNLALHCEDMLIAQVGDALVQRALAMRSQTMEAANPTNDPPPNDYLNSPRPLIQIAVNVGRQEGRREGLQAGELGARAKVVVELLDHRGVPVDSDTRARILACREPETLARWLIAAFEVTDAAQLLEG